MLCKRLQTSNTLLIKKELYEIKRTKKAVSVDMLDDSK